MSQSKTISELGLDAEEEQALYGFDDNEELFDCNDEWKNAYLHGMWDAQSGSQPSNRYPHNSDLFHAYNAGCHNAQLEEGVEEFVLDHDNLPF